jgi:hypothetical protein
MAPENRVVRRRLWRTLSGIASDALRVTVKTTIRLPILMELIVMRSAGRLKLTARSTCMARRRPLGFCASAIDQSEPDNEKE